MKKRLNIKIEEVEIDKEMQLNGMYGPCGGACGGPCAYSGACGYGSHTGYGGDNMGETEGFEFSKRDKQIRGLFDFYKIDELKEFTPKDKTGSRAITSVFCGGCHTGR